ncbi:hypothetical protein D3C83_02310 [compost metagenome]
MQFITFTPGVRIGVTATIMKNMGYIQARRKIILVIQPQTQSRAVEVHRRLFRGQGVIPV